MGFQLLKNFAAALTLCAAVFFHASPALAQPAQWNYTAPGNVSTATYLGDVIILGNCTGCSAGGGTVSSVGLSLPNIFSVTGSPVTSAGTLTGTLATQSANTVWTGPATGAAAAPTFRALVAADIPTLSIYLTAANNLSDVASAATARTNLGVTATGADTVYNFRSNNLSDVASVATARTNLGVTATGADTVYNFRSNNLSDVASAATSRLNLGLVIGTNVQAWGTSLDAIAAGTWTGATSITTLGTITGGTWNGGTLAIGYGGTGRTSFGTGVATALGVNTNLTTGLATVTIGTFTPTGNGFTNVGSPTLSANYVKVGPIVVVTEKIVPATSTASTAGSSYLVGGTFTPIDSTGATAGCTAVDNTTGAAPAGGTGVGYANNNVGTLQIFPPAWTANVHTILLTCTFQNAT
jgi:hypothetical protein